MTRKNSNQTSTSGKSRLILELYLVIQSTFFAFQAPPTLNPELRNRSVALNSTLNLTCVVRGDQPLQIKWTKNGVDLGNKNSNVYIVDHMTINHTGLYGCMAENWAGKTHAILWIDVTGKVHCIKLIRPWFPINH